MVTNADVARMLRELAVYLEMEAEPFKPRAYEKAAEAVSSLDRPIVDLYAEGGIKALATLPFVGKGIAERIEEYIKSGHLREHERFRQKIPVDIGGLMAIEGIGPKTIKALYEQLGIRTVADLEAAARAGRVRSLPHFGDKSEQKILRAIAFLKRTRGRLPLFEVLDLASSIEHRLAGIRGVTRAAIAGSVRRRKETIGDLDFLVAAEKPARVLEAFVTLPEVVLVHAKGSTKSSVRLSIGIDADLRVVPEASFGAALAYFTGSKDHNVALRRIALERGWKLNEYGLFDGKRQVAGRTEEEVYGALGLPYIPPELRENTGELEAAQNGRLPSLIEYDEVIGDLQIQTTWTDGNNTIEEMAIEARKLGRQYIAITDHTRALAMTGGSDEPRLHEQIAAIRKLDRALRGIRVLCGAEVNIDKEGALDIADETLAMLDVVGVAVHSHFNLSREEQTRRLIRAMENPHVDILFHPTGRRIGKREPIDVDIDAVIATAKRTGTVLEIDAAPDRLDLKDEYVRRAVEAGVKLTIDSDAHSVKHLSFIERYGVAVARRGWAKKSDVINTLPVERFLASLKHLKQDGKDGGRRLTRRPRKSPVRTRSRG